MRWSGERLLWCEGRSFMNWVRDPLVTFVLVGIVVFVIAGVFAEEEISYDLEIGEAEIQRLRDHWQAQMLRPATDDELH